MQRRIIVVEDEEDLSDLLALHLRREGYLVSCHGDGAEAMAAIEREVPDFVVLDIMLPGLDGFEICRRMRRDERLSEIPILVVSARGEDADIVSGLELGADSYVVKPISPRVLVARVRALMRRGDSSPGSGERIRIGPVEIDSGRHEVRVEEELVEMTHSEFRILRFLASRPGRVRTRRDILEAIDDQGVLERTVDVHVASLRRKLGEAGGLIETVRGVGYRARDPR
jgi:two-component system, OmpR family, alkaline phosphatase synthesis response regulator PhoP